MTRLSSHVFLAALSDHLTLDKSPDELELMGQGKKERDLKNLHNPADCFPLPR